MHISCLKNQWTPDCYGNVCIDGYIGVGNSSPSAYITIGKSGVVDLINNELVFTDSVVSSTLSGLLGDTFYNSSNTGYFGNPNDISVPAVLQNASIGTEYEDDSTNLIWKKKSSAWELISSIDQDGTQLIVNSNNAIGLGLGTNNTDGYIYSGLGDIVLAAQSGDLKFTDSTGVDFGSVKFGGVTDSFPSLKRIGRDIHFMLASGTDYTSMACNSIDAYGGIRCRGNAYLDGYTIVDDNLAITGQVIGSAPITYTPTGTTQTINFNKGNYQIIDLESAAGDVTVTFINAFAGSRYTVEVMQNSVTPFDIVWVNVMWPGGLVPVISTGSNAVDKITFDYNGTVFYGSPEQDYS